MKKTSYLLATILIGVMVSCSKSDPAAIVERYMQEVNYKELTKAEQCTYYRISSLTSGIEVISEILIKLPDNKIRMRMGTGGIEMNVMIDGNKGWLKTPEGIIDLPAENIKSMTASANLVANMDLGKEKYTYKFIEDKDGLQVIKLIPKDPQSLESIARFNKETGLLESMEKEVNGVKAIITLINYKQFGKIKMPTMMVTEIGNEKVVVSVIDYQMDFPATDDMFAKPTEEEVLP